MTNITQVQKDIAHDIARKVGGQCQHWTMYPVTDKRTQAGQAENDSFVGWIVRNRGYNEEQAAKSAKKVMTYLAQVWPA